MTKRMIQNVLMAICASVFLSACAHYGHHGDCACGKDKKTCEHHQNGQDDKKADEECKDCKK